MEDRKKKTSAQDVCRGAESRHLQSHEDVKWMEIKKQKTIIALSCDSKFYSSRVEELIPETCSF